MPELPDNKANILKMTLESTTQVPSTEDKTAKNTHPKTTGATVEPLAETTVPLSGSPATMPSSDSVDSTVMADNNTAIDSITNPVLFPSPADTDAETPQISDVESSMSEKTRRKPSVSLPKPNDLELDKELNTLKVELEKLSPKHTARLATINHQFNRLRKFIEDHEQSLHVLANSLQDILNQKSAENEKHQQILKEQAHKLVAQLKSALEEGKSNDALSSWDKIQNSISHTNGNIRKELQALSQPLKAGITELRDWKLFAATEKKKELIEKMDKLQESILQPGDKIKHINSLHKQWKELGRSNQNEELWQLFRKSSDIAWEPCKEYLKQRKQLMTKNLQARRQLSDDLETLLKNEAETESGLSITDLDKVLKESETRWKQHAPVEHNRIKGLQIRYNKIRKQLLRLKRHQLKANTKQKMDLLNQAEALLKLDDPRKAMNKAKSLQQQWKQAGQGNFKEDRVYWEKFRAVCDEIFAPLAREREERAKTKSRQKLSQTKASELLGTLEKLCTLEGEALRAVLPGYKDQQQSFASCLEDIQGNQRKTLLERFNNIKRKLDTRIKSLPDKKSQQLFTLIQGCLEYLCPLEAKLLGPNPDLQAVQNDFDAEHWTSLLPKHTTENPSISKQGNPASKRSHDNLDTQILTLLQARVGKLTDSKDIADYHEAVELAGQQLKLLCIEAEIRTGSESPETDKAQRMEIQLKQLKKGFGQRQPDRESDLKFIQQSRMKCLCIGPVSEQDKLDFNKRLEKSLGLLG